MKTGFIDWTGQGLSLYVFEKDRHVDTVDVAAGAGVEPPDITPFLKAALSETYLSVPSSFLTLRELSFPFTDRAKIGDTLPYELEGLLLGSVSDYAIDHIITASSGSSCELLAVCLDKARLAQILRTFTTAGLEPKVITSLDLRLSKGSSEKLLGGMDTGQQERIAAARTEIKNPSINLRQDELAYTGDIERLKRSLRLTASLLLLILLVLGAYTFLKFKDSQKENRLLTQELQAVYKSVFPEDKKIVDAVSQFKGNLTALREKRSVLGGIPVLDILDNIAQTRSGAVVLNEFSADGKNLIMKGTASSFEEVDAFKKTLSAAYNGVKVINSDASADRKVNFTLLMQEKEI